MESHLCKPYAQLLCDGTGAIWVCYLCYFVDFMTIIFSMHVTVNENTLGMCVADVCCSDFMPSLGSRG